MSEKRYSIVYEDDAVIIVDKPSGMLVIPTPKRETNTLSDILNRDLDLRGIQVNAYPCHRLDRETSGLILYAKGKGLQGRMMEEFKKRSVKKEYIAFANGVMRKSTDIIHANIFNVNKKRSEPAVTKYRVVKQYREFALVEAEPVTGRTNQIRIHFKSIGHPLLGETVYAFRKDFKIKFRRVALHAARLSFIHPVARKSVTFSSPLPADMKDLLEKYQ